MQFSIWRCIQRVKNCDLSFNTTFPQNSMSNSRQQQQGVLINSDRLPTANHVPNSRFAGISPHF